MFKVKVVTRVAGASYTEYIYNLPDFLIAQAVADRCSNGWAVATVERQ